jgi:hypothetical protein
MSETVDPPAPALAELDLSPSRVISPPANSVSPPWTPAQKYWFRAAFVYVLFYLLHLAHSYSPIPVWQEGARKTFRAGADWVMKRVAMPDWFGRILGTGCGADERAVPWCWTYEVLWLWSIVLAVALVWTLIDRRRQDYDRLNRYLRATIRYSVAFICWNYAMGKFSGVQFWYRSPFLLVTPIGAWDRMDLMWTTMGVSVVYGMFTGVGEAIAAVLLLFRRTATLGAITAIAIMGVIALLDVIHHAGGVGGNAFHSMALSTVLLVPDMRRLQHVYILNRRAPSLPLEPRAVRGKAGAWLKLVAVAYVAWLPFRPKGTNSDFKGFWNARHPLSGLYEVDHHARNRRELLPFSGDTLRWEYVDLTGANGTFRGSVSVPDQMLTVRDGGYAGERYSLKFDTVAKQLRVMQRRDSLMDTIGVLHYERPTDRSLVLKGTIRNDTLNVSLRKLELDQSVLYGGRGYQFTRQRSPGDSSNRRRASR